MKILWGIEFGTINGREWHELEVPNSALEGKNDAQREAIISAHVQQAAESLVTYRWKETEVAAEAAGGEA